MIIIHVDNRLRFDRTLQNSTKQRLKHLFTHRNPKFIKLRKMNFWTGKEKEFIRTYEDLPSGEFSLPRGGTTQVREVMQQEGLQYRFVDHSYEGPTVDIPDHKLELYPYQSEAMQACIARRNCLLQSPTGSGKTTIALAMIASLKLRTVIVVWGSNLAQQWIERLKSELGMSEDQIGTIMGGKVRVRDITIAMQQTLHSKGVDALGLDKHFGLFIADECIESGPRAMVEMEVGGFLPIEQIRVGDFVAVGGRVLRIMRRNYTGIMHRINGVGFTPNHPIASGKDWVLAGGFRHGDCVWNTKNSLVFPPTDTRKLFDSNKVRPKVNYYKPEVSNVSEGLLQTRARVLPYKVESTKVYNLETENGVYIVGGILVHNCQRFCAKTYRETTEPFHSKYRVGLSADYTRNDKLEPVTRDIFGQVAYEIAPKTLSDANFIHEVEIRIIPTSFEADWYRTDNNFTLLTREMGEDEIRNELIVQIVKQCVVEEGRSVMVFCHRVNHCRALEATISTLKVPRIPAELLLGGKAMSDRFANGVRGLKDGSIKVGVGTIQAIGQAIDIPVVDRGIIATPISNNRQQFQQVIGRICRTAKGKTDAVVYYLWDKAVYGMSSLNNLNKWNEKVVVLGDGAWIPCSEYIREHRIQIRSLKA